jgi:hypothetical protein
MSVSLKECERICVYLNKHTYLTKSQFICYIILFNIGIT